MTYGLAGAAAFREEIRSWLADNYVGEFTVLGPGANFTHRPDLRREWEQRLAAGGWLGLAWPEAYGGRELTVHEEVIFHEEYVRAQAPQRVGFFGENLLGPTLMVHGSEKQRLRFLPGILRAQEMWCQGFSEPGAGSDLANVATTATLDGDRWVVDGQKLWTSRAQYADWIFLLCRSEASSGPKHRGLSFLLLPMNQPGVEVRPLRDMSGGTHFAEVFFDGATTAADCIVGQEGDGWSVAMTTLGFERGTAFIARQLQFAVEFDNLLAVARANGSLDDPVLRDRIAESYTGLALLRFNGRRTIERVAAGERLGADGSIAKLLWSTWHQRFGELAMDVLGSHAMLVPPGGDEHQFWHNFLFSRAHTIYAGSTQVQRNILGERILGLPR